MLVISRELGSSVHIGDEVTVTVLGISKNQVRIGIHAPREVHIIRDDAVMKVKKPHA